LSSVYPSKVSETCIGCHGNSKFQGISGSGVILNPKLYRSSVHGRPSTSRNLSISATCVDCHGAHSILSRSDPLSSVSYTNQAATCKRCHEKEAGEYAKSAHGQAVAKGAHEAPTCSDCHGEHGILSHTNPLSPTYRLAIAQNLCIGCHDRPALQQKFGLAANRSSTYAKSYHGLAVRGKSAIAAVCTDCHETHRILGENDPASSIHPSNRAKTCQRCHTDAASRFTSAEKIHSSYEDHWLTNMVKISYRLIISGTLGGMLVWVAIIMLPELKKKVTRSLSNSRRRFSVSETVQHILLLTSFITLAITGFALAFPDAFLVKKLLEFGIFDERSRSLIHRIAGLTLLAVGVWHIIYLAITRRGRWFVLQLIPKIADIKSAIQHLLYSIGIKKEHPHFKHFSYFEKAEYWALVWGTIVMAATGIILWFPEKMPRLLVFVCEAIHLYEAILAVGAIIIWHFFFVFIEPSEFPFNPSIFTGRAPKDSELDERTEEPPKEN